MTLITPGEDLSPEDAADLDAIYGSVERFLSCAADYQAALPGLPPPAAPPPPAPTVALLRALAAGPRAAPAAADGRALVARIHGQRVLPTGCDAIDDLLHVGLREGAVLEVAGETSSGKTQLCLQAAAMRALHGERVLYVDTTNGFSAARAARLCEAQRAAIAAEAEAAPGEVPAPLGVEASLDNISVVRPHSVHALISCLDELSVQLSQGPDSRCLLIIDSISAVLAPIVGVQQHQQGQVLVGAVGSLLRHIADEYSVAVLITNHVVGAGAGPGAGGGAAGGGAAGGGAGGDAAGAAAGGAFKPALGAQWRGQPHARIQLSRASLSSGVMVATLTQSNSRVCGAQQAFVVTYDGLESVS